MAKFQGADNFPEANGILGASPGTEAQVGDLAVFRQCWPHVLQAYNQYLIQQGKEPISLPEGPTCVISKWKFTPEELVALNASGGEFYLQFMGGTHSPVAVWGASPWWPNTQVEPEYVGDKITEGGPDEDGGIDVGAR